MTKIFSVLSILLLVLMAFPLTALAADVSGEWEMTITTPRGERVQTIKFEQDGENLKVTMVTQRGETTGEGTIKDNKIEWTITRETPRGQFTMTYTGTVEGDTMSGTYDMRGNPVEWKATKK